ncbi:MAG: terminase TerL endonuclease subunit [Pseudomonadota bacterium]
MKRFSFWLALVAGFFIADTLGADMETHAKFGDGDYWYDTATAEAAVNFFSDHLRLTKGKWARKPFHLEDWQKEKIIRPLFGWKRHDNSDPAKCTRKYRQVYVEVPKKNGKTELAAGIGLLLLVGDGELGGEGYAIANNKNQAMIAFSVASAMVNYSPTLPEHLELFKTSIYCPSLNSGIYPLSGKPEGKHGKNPSFIIGDEVHEWVDGQLYSFLATGMAARSQPVEFLITTAGKRQGFGFEFHNKMRKISEGVVDEPETLVVRYGADFEDDWQDPNVWIKANPNLNVSVNMDYLERKYRIAKEDPTEENEFKRYHLNLWTEQDVRWLVMDKWMACSRNKNDTELWSELRDEMRGRPCFGGVDLSSTEDITAVVWVFPPAGGDNKWVIVPRFWIPNDNVYLRVRKDRVPYDKWLAWGAMEATEGDVIDYDFIEAAINEDAEIFDVQSIAYDPWRATQLVNNLLGAGRPMIKFSQTIHNFAAPTKEFKRLVIKGEFEHGNHPVLRWMASNIAVKTDPNGNERPAKDKATERIDGIVAAIMALGLATQGDGTEDFFPADYGMVSL